MLMPTAINSSIAGMPAVRAGHLDHQVRASHGLNKRFAWSIVPCVLSAKSGETSKLT